ncbi:MAG: hypothetical protein WCN98_01835 [Verrucomicrobiaceae bacterium]
MNFHRRLGPDPHAQGMQSVGLNGCPDLWELDNGDIAVIGIDITVTCASKLPPTAGCGPDERIVRVPRGVFLAAKADVALLH